jgi:hypothetical protein
MEGLLNIAKDNEMLNHSIQKESNARNGSKSMAYTYTWCGTHQRLHAPYTNWVSVCMDLVFAWKRQ